jgi:hypothetical protein
VHALIIDKEHPRKKRKWVHQASMKRGVEGQPATLYKELADDETIFFNTSGCHNILPIYY